MLQENLLIVFVGFGISETKIVFVTVAGIIAPPIFVVTLYCGSKTNESLFKKIKLEGTPPLDINALELKSYLNVADGGTAVTLPILHVAYNPKFGPLYIFSFPPMALKLLPLVMVELA